MNLYIVWGIALSFPCIQLIEKRTDKAVSFPLFSFIHVGLYLFVSMRNGIHHPLIDCGMMTVLLVIAWIDWRTMDIYHDTLIVLCCLIGFHLFFHPMDRGWFIFYGLLFLLFLGFSKKTQKIGEGDVYLIFLGSLFLHQKIFLSLQLACWSALAYVISTKKHERFPFAPFLCFSFIVLYFV